MKIKDVIMDFLVISVLVYLVSIVVSYLYSLIVHGFGIVDWGGSMRSAIIMGIALTYVKHFQKK